MRAALSRFDDLASRLVARSGVPGAAVAVVAGDRAVYVRCFGVRESGRPERVDKDTLFQLGPLSRTFTATMLAALVSEHEVGWDQPVRASWPGFTVADPWVSRQVTYRDLLGERCGLPVLAGDELVRFGYGRGEILSRLRRLGFATGFRTAYAEQNALVTAAATSAEHATGRSWAYLVRTRVLTPLRMRTTALTYREYVSADDRATPHCVRDGVMRAQALADTSVFAPAIGVSSTVAELVPFVRLQLNGGALAGERVAGAAALRAALTPATSTGVAEGGVTAAALGWDTGSYDGRLVVSQDGGLAAGASAAVSLVPDDGVGVIVLANAYPQGIVLARALTRSLIDLYAEGALREDWLSQVELWPDAAPEATVERLPEAAPETAAPPRRRGAYTGVYGDSYYGRVTVAEGVGDALRVRLGRGETLRVVPWDGDVWREPESNTAVEFHVRDGHAVSVRFALLTFAGRDGTFARR